MQVHEANKAQIKPNEFGVAQYDLIFYGDDLVENLNGTSYGDKIPQSTAINQYYKDTFTFDGEDSNINALALGITGDSVRDKSTTHIHARTIPTLTTEYTFSRNLRRLTYCGDWNMVRCRTRICRCMSFGS